MLKWLQGNISAVTGIAEPEYGQEYIHTVADKLKGKQPYHVTSREDFDWQNPDHTNVETVTFYFSDLKTGITGFAQIIHSSVIPMHKAAQFTFRIFDSKNPEDLNIWTSTKLENFRTDGPNFYADDLSIELSEDNTQYHIISNVCERSTVDLYIKRLTPGAKAGEDPTTYYGDNLEVPWGTMRHVFWPRNSCHGTINVKKVVEVDEVEVLATDMEATDLNDKADAEEETEEADEDEEEEEDDESDSEYDSDSEYEDEIEVVYEERTYTFEVDDPAYCMFIMALQGMKPHHAAKAWNFVYVHTPEHTALLIEYITPKSYANTKVTVGVVTSKDDVMMLSLDNNYEHLNPEIDEVGWPVPHNIRVEFNGVSKDVTDEQVENGTFTEKDKVTAVIEAPLKNMVERVDVMGEIPGFVKNIVSGIAGTNPFIYQYSNDEFSLQVNDGKKSTGLGWAEVTFISQSDVVTEESYNED